MGPAQQQEIAKLMRSDMHKVIVERPRAGRSWAKQFPRPKVALDELPKCQGMKRPHGNGKYFTDLLGPLRRWMRAQVGRPWNEVYSEACAVIKPDSIVRAHIKTHLLEFVQRHTFMHEGRVWCFANRWGQNEMPVERAANHWSPFYVHPESRLLCEVPARPRHRWSDHDAERRAQTQRWLQRGELLRQMRGLWFICEVKTFPTQFAKGESPLRFDFGERRPINRSQARRIYGREVYCIAKRQLSRRELKRNGLRNIPLPTGPLVIRERVTSRPAGFSASRTVCVIFRPSRTASCFFEGIHQYQSNYDYHST